MCFVHFVCLFLPQAAPAAHKESSSVVPPAQGRRHHAPGGATASVAQRSAGSESKATDGAAVDHGPMKARLDAAGVPVSSLSYLSLMMSFSTTRLLLPPRPDEGNQQAARHNSRLFALLVQVSCQPLCIVHVAIVVRSQRLFLPLVYSQRGYHFDGLFVSGVQQPLRPRSFHPLFSVQWLGECIVFSAVPACVCGVCISHRRAALTHLHLLLLRCRSAGIMTTIISFVEPRDHLLKLTRLSKQVRDLCRRPAAWRNKTVLIGCAWGLLGRGCLPLCQLPENKWRLVLEANGIRREQCKPIPPQKQDAKSEGPPAQVHFLACDMSTAGHGLAATLRGSSIGLVGSAKLSPSLTELDVSRMSIDTSARVGLLLTGVAHMPRLKSLAVDFSHFTDADAEHLLRVCPPGMVLKQHSKSSVSTFPPCLELFRWRLVSFRGCVSTAGVAALAKCKRLRQVTVWFDRRAPDSSADAMHDIARRLVQAKVPVSRLCLEGFSDCKLAAQFKGKLRYMTVSNASVVDVSLFRPRTVLADGLVSLHLRSCHLDANSCSLLATARICELRLEDCRFGRGFELRLLDLEAAQTVLAPLKCEYLVAPAGLMIRCTPQCRRSASIVVE